MALFLDLGPNDVLRVGEDTFITIEKKSGQRARLRITGSGDVEMTRKPTDDRGAINEIGYGRASDGRST